MAGYLRMRILNRASLRDKSLRRRHLRDVTNPLDIPAGLFIAHYRLSQDIFIILCDRLRPLFPVCRRKTGVPLELQVLTTLSFLATGSYQKVIGSGWNSCNSQKAVSRHINQIVSLLNSIMAEYIKFPGTREERNEIKQGFHEKFQFPGVTGCIDGTHIAMIAPQIHEETYFNRKGFHSMNAIMICDSNLKILAVCARYGGASHDPHIWQLMAIKPYIKEICLQESLWLLGDSAFPLRPYMMTPILSTVPGSQTFRYTNMHSKARNCIERCFGVLKARWRCLLNHHVLHYTPEMTVKIINACAVLHNIAIVAGMPEPADLHMIENNLREIAAELYIDRNHDNLQLGQFTQHELVENF